MWLDQLGQDARAGARGVARYPIAALVSVASVGFGLGAMMTTLPLRTPEAECNQQLPTCARSIVARVKHAL